MRARKRVCALKRRTQREKTPIADRRAAVSPSAHGKKFYQLKTFCVKQYYKEVITLSANLEAKKQVVEEIKQKIQNSKSVVFVDYKGLTVAEVSELRNKFRAAGVEYKVYKNTLVRKAMNELGVTAFDNDLNGPTATAFSPDETAAAKIFAEAVKAMPEKIIPKSAYVDNAYVDANGIKALASMPSKEELIAKMLGSMQAPIANFAGVLSAMLRGVVVALNAIAEKKGA